MKFLYDLLEPSEFCYNKNVHEVLHAWGIVYKDIDVWSWEVVFGTSFVQNPIIDTHSHRYILLVHQHYVG